MGGNCPTRIFRKGIYASFHISFWNGPDSSTIPSSFTLNHKMS